MHGKQAGDALDHHFAHVVLGLADQRDTADRKLTIDGNEIPLSEVRDVVFKSLSP